MSTTARSVDLTVDPSLLIQDDSWSTLLRQLLILATPVFAEHLLHICVGWNDTYLANHIHRYEAISALSRADETAAGAAVGTMTYILWFLGLIVSAIATGSTAIIARAIGAKHRSLANSICGQSIALAILVGIVGGVMMYVLAGPIADLAGLEFHARDYAFSYLRILSIAMPFTMVMFVAGPCLRGAGDTLTPAVIMIVVDIINMVFSFGMTYGWWHLPRLGFDGIAWGTSIAYISGGVIHFVALMMGRGGIRLYLHRMRPHWHNLKRLLRIGLPGGTGDLLQWLANFGVVRFVNEMGPAQGNAHNITIRIESMSYMLGYAVATAAATMVGQSLGMKRPVRAARSAYVSYAVAGGIMTTMGVAFILLGKYPAMLFSDDPQVRSLTTQCLFITGFIQSGFAAALVFGGSLRGAGDTFVTMLINMASILTIRLGGAWFVARVLHLGLPGVWCVLASELFCRGILMFTRFRHGAWKKIVV